MSMPNHRRSWFRPRRSPAPLGIIAAAALVAAASLVPTGAAFAGSTMIASDGFSRDVTDGWGTAGIGGQYEPIGPVDGLRVAATVGTATLGNAAQAYGGFLPDARARDTDLRVNVSLDRLPSGMPLTFVLAARHAPGSEYRGRITVGPDGSVRAHLAATARGSFRSLVDPVAVPGLTMSPGQMLGARLRVMGAAPATLSLKVWPAGQTEPTGWTVSVDDGTPELADAGSVGVRATSWEAAGASGPITASFDALRVRRVESSTIDTPPPPPPVPASEPVALGVYIPGAPMDPSKIDDYADLVGAMPSVVMWYTDWSGRWNDFYRSGADAVRARGAMPLITWEPWAGSVTDSQWTLRSIADGSHDAYIRSFARDVAAWGHPLYLRPMHEMNGTWTSWSPGVNGNTAADFVPAWRHMVDVARAEGATNVRWVWCPNVQTSSRFTPFSQVYPGDGYVDWVCLDGYNWGTSRGNSAWRSFATIFTDSINAVSSLTDKPMMIGETGSSELGGDKAT
ncbi:MAG: glycosyl hydrolase, partial [Candidatus Limnocylindrales bacterium]